MIFVCVKAGLYYILENDHVVGEIFRAYDNSTYYRYPKQVYHLSWRRTHTEDDENARTETFDTLADIQDKYKFSNYGGYNAVLKRRN